MLVFWLSLVMAAAGCLGLFLAGKGKWQGWAIGLAVQSVWMVFAIITEAYGLIITAIMYAVVYGRNLIKWYKERDESRFATNAVASGVYSVNELREMLRKSDGGNPSNS